MTRIAERVFTIKILCYLNEVQTSVLKLTYCKIQLKRLKHMVLEILNLWSSFSRSPYANNV